ncbi:MAG: hypothetical protein WA542_05965 [Candidatus Acidiferrum sp.]
MARLLVVFGLFVGATTAQIPRASMPSRSSVAKPSTSTAQDSTGELPCPQNRKETTEAQYGDYLIETYRWPEPDGCVQISRRGKVIYSLVSGEFQIGNNFYGFQNGPKIPVGADITGGGKPNAIVSEWSGGVHCCFTMHVFEIGEHFREIAQIQADDSDGAHFVDLDHDGSYEFDGNDWAFAYWGASFMDSPAPRIVLKYRGGRFRLAFDLMARPGPTHKEFIRLAHDIRSDDEWTPKHAGDCVMGCGVPVALWRNMLELIYTGHADLAWQLLDESWPPNQRNKSSFVAQFCKQLHQSHYWFDLEQAIGTCPPTLKR